MMVTSWASVMALEKGSAFAATEMMVTSWASVMVLEKKALVWVAAMVTEKASKWASCLLMTPAMMVRT